MKRLSLILMLIFFVINSLWGANKWTLLSPGGNLRAKIAIEKGNLIYTVQQGSTVILAPSTCSMTLLNGMVLGKAIKSVKVLTGQKCIKAKTPFYRKANVDESCNTLVLNMGKYSIEFQAFNGGIAYRFCTRFVDSICVVSDDSRFVLPQDLKLYYLSFANVETDFQGIYQYNNLSKIKRDEFLAPQLVAEFPDGKSLFLSDFNVLNYPTMFLRADGKGALCSYFASYPKQEMEYGKYNTRLKVVKTENFIAKTKGTRIFPWKMILVAQNDAALLTTDIPYSLAAPSEVKDLSWIRPGKASWEWWNAENLKGVNFRTGINNATYKYFIDFSSRNGIKYILMDEGWSKRQIPIDLLQTNSEINLPELVAYGKSKNVGIILWSDFHPFDQNMEKVVTTYANMGIKGFKIDHINRNDQKVVDFTQRAAKMCAEHHMLIDFHGVFPPTGLQFTYPNVLNYEAVLGLEIVKNKDVPDMVRHECIVPFIRQVVGPIDYTQGAMRNATRENFYSCRTQPMSQGTRCRQLAEYVIFESPFNMLCDAPTQYEENQKCTDFIGKVPVVWDETRILSAKIGEYIIEARRKGNTWFLGGITNWISRDVILDLSFIKGRKISLYMDGINADRNAEDYSCTEGTFNKVLKIHMASGGGFAGIIEESI